MYCKIPALCNTFLIILNFWFLFTVFTAMPIIFPLARRSFTSLPFFCSVTSTVCNLRKLAEVTKERVFGFSNVPVPYSSLPQVTGWRGSNDLSPTLAILLNKRIIYIYKMIIYIYARTYNFTTSLCAAVKFFTHLLCLAAKTYGSYISVSLLFLSDSFRHKPSNSFAWGPE